MITILFKLVLLRMFGKFRLPKILPISYTISVTDKCNSKCRTCNIHNNRTPEMSLEDYEYLFRDLGRSPYWVTISGGEPFLRKDLPEILQLLRTYCRPSIINIPTNGILTARIITMVETICENLSDTSITINLSIDGIEKQHDYIRNVKGNYQKAIDTYNVLKRLKYPNLTVGIHSVISTFNVESFARIAQTLIQLNPDSYVSEIAEERKEMNNFDQGITPEAIKYRAAIDFLLHEIKNSKFKGLQRITQAFRVEYYDLVKKILKYKKMIIPCYAGIASCQIATDGTVWFCCVKAQNIGRVERGRYSFREIWFSQTAKKHRKAIRKNRCFCPLANASYTNMLLSIPILLKVFYRSYIKWYR